MAEAQGSVNRSFPQAIRSALTNSNKSQYLIQTSSGHVPNTRKVTRDTAILQKLYHNKVPKDIHLEAETFQLQIDMYEEKFKRPKQSSDPILKALKSKGVTLPEHDKKR